MKFRKLIIVPVVITAAALAGCASQSAKEVNLNLKYMTAKSAPANSNDANAQAQVAEAASSVGHSLNRLSAIQMATHKGVKMPMPLNARAVGLAHQGSLSWNGPVEPAVAKIASASGYRVRVLGSKPSIPVIVNVNARNKTMAEILRNITFQAEPGATIRVYPGTHVIELRYNHK